jgi:hypothetical protein
VPFPKPADSQGPGDVVKVDGVQGQGAANEQAPAGQVKVGQQEPGDLELAEALSVRLT